MTTAPKRAQLSRSKGWRLPPGTVKVDRTTRWGNPWPIGRPGPDGDVMATAEQAADRYEMLGLDGDLAVTREDVRRELRGKDLACWCRLDQACHADVLLRVANTEPVGWCCERGQKLGVPVCAECAATSAAYSADMRRVDAP